jgi:hypothetical protein
VLSAALQLRGQANARSDLLDERPMLRSAPFNARLGVRRPTHRVIRTLLDEK